MLANMTNRPALPLEAEQIINGYFPVLDHGFIALKDVMGSDEAIEEAARTSYQFGTRQKSQTRGLLRYLKRHQHSTPFEMVELKFHVSMPIFVARQWVRTRTASINEVSGRYSILPMLFYTPEHEDFKLQSKDNKQGRAGEADAMLWGSAINGWEMGRSHAQSQYEWLASQDVARELARIDLPLSTYTNWYWKINLHNLMRFMAQRTHSHAQKEIRVYGELLAGMVQTVAPIAYEAWLDYDRCGLHLSYGEAEVIRSIVGATRVRTDKETQEKDGIVVGSRLPKGEGFSATALKAFGLDAREIDELYAKLQPQGRPDYTLDLSKMQPGEFFQEKMAAAVPKVG